MVAAARLSHRSTATRRPARTRAHFREVEKSGRLRDTGDADVFQSPGDLTAVFPRPGQNRNVARIRAFPQELRHAGGQGGAVLVLVARLQEPALARTILGDEVIRWYRGRCGKCEEVHAVMKNDLAGGHLPSAQFGADAAWWGITVLAYNLNSMMKRLAMPEGWAPKRLKAIRFGLINIAGRVVTHAHRLIIRLSQSHPAYRLLVEVRRRIHALSHPSAEGGLTLAQGPP